MRPRIWPIGYYVYMFCYPNLTPYYVGMGKGRRAGDRLRNPWVNHISEKIRSSGGEPRLLLLDVPDREWAVLLERQLIKDYGRRHLGTGVLVNITDGGDGGSAGRVLSADARARISAAQRGRSPSPETRALISLSLTGNQRRLGKPHSPEVRAKISAAGLGKKMSISEAERERRAAHTRRLNATQVPPRLGKKCTEEHKRKVSEAARRRYARNKG